MTALQLRLRLRCSRRCTRGPGGGGGSFFFLRTKMSWHSLLTIWYSTLRIKVVEFYDYPTNSCGSGSDTQ